MDAGPFIARARTGKSIPPESIFIFSICPAESGGLICESTLARNTASSISRFPTTVAWARTAFSSKGGDALTPINSFRASSNFISSSRTGCLCTLTAWRKESRCSSVSRLIITRSGPSSREATPPDWGATGCGDESFVCENDDMAESKIAIINTKRGTRFINCLAAITYEWTLVLQRKLRWPSRTGDVQDFFKFS